MIAYLCNCCNKPLDMLNDNNVHLEIRYGKKAIESKGQYGSGWNADLCEDCFESLRQKIDKYYYGGNAYLSEEEHCKIADTGKI